MYRHFLVPVDSTDVSADLVASAVDFAAATNAKVTFLHAGRVRCNQPDESAHAEVRDYPDDSWNAPAGVLAKAEAAARAWGVPCESMRTVCEESGAAIITAAQTKGCDLILIASHANHSSSGSPPSAEAIHVLSHSSLPVLVAATAGPQPQTPVIAVIRDEHRSLAAVVHAWNEALILARTAGVAPDMDLMRSILSFIGRLEDLHHPREQQLFSLLRTQTSSVDADLNELERQHQREQLLLSEVAHSIDALSTTCSDLDPPCARLSLEKSVADYARHTWEHVGRVEAVILPAARRFLPASDWSKLERAFAQRGPDGVVGSHDPEYRRLFGRMLDAAAGASPRN